MSRTKLVSAVLALAATACAGPPPVPTGSVCPSDSTLTYDNFGQPFMKDYCTKCHSSELKGGARHGAPLYHDFDTYLGIMEVANHIDSWSAAGPDSVNEIMPQNDPKPTIDERYKLGEWLACEVAKQTAGDAGIPDSGTAVDAGVDAP
jgi:hypothetical protein